MVRSVLLGAVCVLLLLPVAASAADPPGFSPADDHLGSTLPRGAGLGAAGPSAPPVAGPEGLDVSGHQPGVDWPSVAADGAAFAYVKATESTSYTSPEFSAQYTGAYGAGLLRGAYHFAIPSSSSGAAQAGFFVDHGGGWSADGRTLPGVLDIEYNPYGASCYGLSQAAMASWIGDFLATYKARTGRAPVIYTTADWWSTCTGGSSVGVDGDAPLWIARYNTSVGTVPGGWGTWTIWQYTDAGRFPGDSDVFNGSSARLQALADG